MSPYIIDIEFLASLIFFIKSQLIEYFSFSFSTSLGIDDIKTTLLLLKTLFDIASSNSLKELKLKPISLIFNEFIEL